MSLPHCALDVANALDDARGRVRMAAGEFRRPLPRPPGLLAVAAVCSRRPSRIHPGAPHESVRLVYLPQKQLRGRYN